MPHRTSAYFSDSGWAPRDDKSVFVDAADTGVGACAGAQDLLARPLQLNLPPHRCGAVGEGLSNERERTDSQSLFNARGPSYSRRNPN